MTRPVYIVLTNTGTLLSKTISKYTHSDLNHASIAFDEELCEVYSFGRKHRHNPFIGGFVQENVTAGVFRHATCVIYRFDVPDATFLRIKHAIADIKENKELYKYNFLGLLAIVFNIEMPRERAYFCSHFVAAVLEQSGIKLFPIPPHRIQPQHFTYISSFTFEYAGNLQDYLIETRGGAYIQPRYWRQAIDRLLA